VNKPFRKAISLVLVTALIMSCGVSLFASAADASCPYIYVHGFMAKDIIADKNNPDSETVWPPAGDKITETVKECIPALLRFLADRNYEKLGEAIIDPCKELLSGANLDTDGNASNGSGVYFEYPAREVINSSSHLNFRYDWRLDPVELASQLHDFIEYVVDAAGCSQVVIECHSFGGTVTEAYVQLYGTSRIKSVCYNTSAIYGETYTGEMMSGNIVVQPDSLTEYIKCLMSENENKELIGNILDLLNDAGITGDITDLLNGIVENLGEELIREILLPMFAGWLSIWAMIPDDYIDSAYDFVFNKLYKNDGIDHSGLQAKIDNFNEIIRPFKTETLTAQNEVANVYVVSRYGYTSVPLTDKWQVMTDTVVDSKFSSFGGTFADYGAVLDDEFVSSVKDSPYLNADETVYAGTCLFPEQTWFIRDLLHSKGPGSLDSLVYALLYYDGQATVGTFEQYPQFLVYDNGSGALNADTGTVEPEKDFGQKMFDFFRKIIRFLRVIFRLEFLRRNNNG